MSTIIQDMKKSGVSSCCSALVYEGMEICCMCGENCSVVADDDFDNEAVENYIKGEKRALGWPAI